MIEILAADIKRNKNNTKGMVIVMFYRIANLLYKASTKHPVVKLVSIPFSAAYKVVVDYLMGAYIPPSTDIGAGLVVFHGYAIVVNAKTIIGDNCTIRQSVTIGSKDKNDSACPRIGNNVDIGAGAIIIGDIVIGNDAIIGAGAVVVKSIPSSAIAVGNPATVIQRRDAC